MVLYHTLKDFEALCKSITAVSLPALKENQLEIVFTSPDVITTDYKLQKQPLPFASSDTFEADISDWVCLTPKESCKAVYQVSLTNTSNNFVHCPGDTIGIIPHNNKAEIDAIIEHLNLLSTADLQYTLSSPNSQRGCKIPPHIPIKSSIRHVLTYCCDIRSVLKKLFLLELSRHTKDDNERKILEYLCSKEGSMAYNTHVLNKRFCLLDLLSTFKSCNPPLKALLVHLPRLLPRPYSIVNSSHTNPNVINICFSVMDLGCNRKGLVTGWLENVITEGKYSIEQKMQSLNINNELKKAKVLFYFRKNIMGFSPPDNLETPMILIGPGTGISPFIGFLEERRHLKCSSEIKAGIVWVFFGCRNPNLDFIYEKELKSFLNDGTISRLSTSFSRVENSQNKYIQDALLLNGEDLVKLINGGASIFLCGDLKSMAVQVKDTLISCFIKYDKKSQHEAETLISIMQTEKRYLVDVWS